MSKKVINNDQTIKKEITLSRLFLEPLLKDCCITKKMIGIYLYNSYSLSPCNKRVWALYQDIVDIDIKFLENNDLFISYEEVEGGLHLFEFLIPLEYVGDISCISIGMYTMVSNNFKGVVLTYWKKKNLNFYEELNKMLNPSKEDYKEMSSDLLLDIDYREVSEMFSPLKESFRLSNILKIK